MDNTNIFYLREWERNFLVNLSVASVFLEDFGIPVSCCNLFTGDRGSLIGGHPMFSPRLWSLLEEQKIHTTNQGNIRVYKLVSHSLAVEVVDIIQWNRYATVGAVMHEFILITSDPLSDDPENHYLRDKGHELLLRRPPVQQRESEVSKPKFSPLVSFLLRYDHPRAYSVVEIVHKAVKHPGNAPISQLLARMFMHDKYYSKAYDFANMAAEANPGNSFYMDTKGRVIIEQMRQYLTHHARKNQPRAAERFLDLLDEGLDTFSQCQILSKSEESKFINLAGYYGELRLIFTFLEILPAFFELPPNQLQKYLLTNKHVPGIQGVFATRRHDIQALQDRVEAAIGYLEDVRTFCEGGLRFQRREFISFCQDRSKFFDDDNNNDDDDEEEEDGDGDDDDDDDNEDEEDDGGGDDDDDDDGDGDDKEDEEEENDGGDDDKEEDDDGDDDDDEEDDDDNGDDEDMDSMCRRRRLQVRSLVEPTLGAVFHLCHNDAQILTKIRDVLSENPQKTSFDRKMLIWVGFALASVETSSDVRGEVERQVQDVLKESSNDSLNGPFFNLLLAWPQRGAGTTERYLKAAEDLKRMWVRLYKFDADSKTVKRSEAKPKPATAFFLSKGRGIGAFIHVSCLPAFNERLEQQDITFWDSDGVKGKLARLEGTLRDTETLLYSVSASEQIPIKLSTRWPMKTREEKVSFYVGFSFAEPMAFNVRVTDDGIKAQVSRC